MEGAGAVAYGGIEPISILNRSEGVRYLYLGDFSRFGKKKHNEIRDIGAHYRSAHKLVLNKHHTCNTCFMCRTNKELIAHGSRANQLFFKENFQKNIFSWPNYSTSKPTSTEASSGELFMRDQQGKLEGKIQQEPGYPYPEAVYSLQPKILNSHKLLRYRRRRPAVRS